MLTRFRGKRVLLLQGPSGPFFRRLARHLERLEATVTKINFNAGDWLYYHKGDVVPYRATPEAWPAFLQDVLVARRIDAVVLFGDCRPLHRTAINTARSAGVEVHVFEEGYLRPDFVTLEQEGVNGNSHTPRDPEFFRRYRPPPLRAPQPLPGTFWRTAWYCTLYAWALTLFWWRYPHYKHHRNQNALWQLYLWTRSGAVKLRRSRRDRAIDQQIASGSLGRYFLVPLQVGFDSQIGHSPFSSVAEFIETVVASFAQHAPSEYRLLLKHHPFDRPYQNYTKLVKQLQERYSLGERLLYADAINLPAALRHAHGTIVINSTVGLSSVHHQTPVKCLGTAVYDIPGITSQQPLDEFWNAPAPVDYELYSKFRSWLLANNQLNGSIWLDVVVEDEPISAQPSSASS